MGKRGISLLIKNPDVANEWDYKKNAPLKPADVMAGSKESAWWICSRCGYNWPASISNRARGSGCPACAGHVIAKGINDFETCGGELLKEWHPTKNLPLLPSEVYRSGGEKVWWMCPLHHEYPATVHDRVKKGTGCPICKRMFKTSIAEQTVFYYIHKYYPSAINAYCPDFLRPSEIDIYVPELKIGIEYDGQQFHKNVKKDLIKDAKCSDNAIKLIRIREPACEQLDRKDPTYILSDLSPQVLSTCIFDILHMLGVQTPKVDVEKEKFFILRSFYNNALTNNLADKYPLIASQWDSEKNGNIDPHYIPVTKSKIKYNWKCNKCGYEWKTTLGERLSGSGCSVCSGKVIIAQKNDLSTTHPEIAKEWHPYKNGEKAPTQFSYGQNERIWWKCGKCGYEWPTRITRRVHNPTCPACQKREQALQNSKNVCQYSKNGAFLREFRSAFEASEALGISQVSILQVCNPRSRNKTAGGFIWKYKRDDLAALYPSLLKEWNYEKNDKDPSQITPGSDYEASWVCSKGHEWTDKVCLRALRNYGCPYCSHHRVIRGVNDLMTSYPDIAKEWNYNKNGDKRPEEYLPKSNVEVWWICKEGHEWPRKICARQNNGCPYCSGRLAIPGKNDFQTLYPILAKDWNYEKNGNRTPDTQKPFSHANIHWKCHKCGHEWEQMLSNRVRRNTPCPECKGKLIMDE